MLCNTLVYFMMTCSASWCQFNYQMTYLMSHLYSTVEPRYFELGSFEIPTISKSSSDSPSFDRHLVLLLSYFETPLFRTYFCVMWDFEIAGFDCIISTCAWKATSLGMEGFFVLWSKSASPDWLRNNISSYCTLLLCNAQVVNHEFLQRVKHSIVRKILVLPRKSSLGKVMWFWQEEQRTWVKPRMPLGMPGLAPSLAQISRYRIVGPVRVPKTLA